MGKHSGQDVFRTITRIGIYNPRLNCVYTQDIDGISDEVIKEVEEKVIGY